MFTNPKFRPLMMGIENSELGLGTKTLRSQKYKSPANVGTATRVTQ